MSTTTVSNDLTTRILQDGYGGEAWHGTEMKGALADLSPELAFWRPGKGRHNIAEIAIHHAYCVHSVRGRLSQTPVEAFPLEGEDWFALADDDSISVKKIVTIVDTQQKKLASLVADVAARDIRARRERTFHAHPRHHLSCRLSRRTDSVDQEAARVSGQLSAISCQLSAQN